MAFGSTITFTVNSVDKVLNRVNQDNFGSEYRLVTDTDAWSLKIRHSEDSPDGDGVVMRRHNMYLEHITYPTSSDPIKKETITWTMRTGKYQGPTQLGYVAKGVTARLTASSGAVVDDLVAGLN